jgi:tetratricopeptide (TPR) repeat protein
MAEADRIYGDLERISESADTRRKRKIQRVKDHRSFDVETRRWFLWALRPAAWGGLCLLLATAQAQPLAIEEARQAMQQGAAAMSAGNFSQAVEACRRETRLQPGFPEAYFNLGLAEEQSGQLDEAHTALLKALQLKPALRGAHLFLGTIAYKQNRFKDAEENFLRETRLDPKNAKAFMWLGVCHLVEDKPEETIALLDKAHQLDPSDVDALYHRGRAYLLVADASYSAMFKTRLEQIGRKRSQLSVDPEDAEKMTESSGM